MNSNKISDSRESSVIAQKNDSDDSQPKDVENNRQNAKGYSWWKWRRSNDSADKKMPSKELEDRKDLRQSVERVDEMKEIINDLDSMSINVSNAAHELQTAPVHNLSVDSANGKNDDSISSELADINKSSFSNEKYRKTLRLTSEQIVSYIL